MLSQFTHQGKYFQSIMNACRRWIISTTPRLTQPAFICPINTAFTPLIHLENTVIITEVIVSQCAIISSGMSQNSSNHFKANQQQQPLAACLLQTFEEPIVLLKIKDYIYQ